MRTRRAMLTIFILFIFGISGAQTVFRQNAKDYSGFMTFNSAFLINESYLFTNATPDSLNVFNNQGEIRIPSIKYNANGIVKILETPIIGDKNKTAYVTEVFFNDDPFLEFVALKSTTISVLNENMSELFSYTFDPAYTVQDIELIQYVMPNPQNVNGLDTVKFMIVNYLKNNTMNEYKSDLFGIERPMPSGILSISLKSTKLFPNPAKNQVSISYDLKKNKKGMLQVFDTNGHFILQKQLQLDTNLINVDISKLMKGHYLYVIQNGGEIVSSNKFIVE